MAEVPTIIAHCGPYVVLSKEPGVAVHATSDKDGQDLVSRLDVAFNYSVAPLGRLDKPASGLCCFLMKDREDGPTQRLSGKVYLACCQGATRAKGVIRRPLNDSRRGRRLEAETRYKAIYRSSKFSLLAVAIRTGRKHQIRRHLSGLGHPVVGDRRYGGTRRSVCPADQIMLHCWRGELGDHGVFYAPPAGAWDVFLEDAGIDDASLRERLAVWP